MIDMPTSECLQMLQENRLGRLSLVGPDGKPYTIPLRFVWHRDSVYVRIAYDGRKQEAISFGRRVCFEIDELQEDFSHYASVLVEGTLLDIHDESEKRSALVALNEKYFRLSGIPSPGENPVVQGVAIRRVAVEKISGRKREPDVPPAATHERDFKLQRAMK